MFLLFPSLRFARGRTPRNRSGGVSWLVRFLVLPGLATCAAAADTSDVRQTFPGSVVEVPELTSAGAQSTPRGIIARRTLTSLEQNEVIEFQIAFQLRNFSELQMRVARGEQISADEMMRRYTPLSADYERTAAWLESHGLSVTLRDPNRLAIFASGSIAVVGDRLQTTFARVVTDEGEFTSAISAPSLPDALASATLGVNGLQPQSHPRRRARLQSLPTNSTSGNGPPFLPGQIARAYHADGLSVTGAGQKIGIVIDTFPATTDLTSFWAAGGIGQSLANIEFVQVVNGTLPPRSGEETIDVEWASSIAPGSVVRVYATTSLSFVNLDKAYQRILSELSSQPMLHQISLSYGAGENYVATTQLVTDAQYFVSLAAGGATVLVASGDGGSSPGTGGHDHTGAVQAETPASDPNVTAVGGTSLHVDAATGATTSESAWYDGGGGISRCFSRPSWQTGSTVPSGTMRLVPDVAAVADSSTGGYLIYNGSAYIIGGTSWSAPTWAGFCALINQARVAAGFPVLGVLGNKIYPLLGSAAFVDTSTGSNGPGGVYNAGVGYDLCTGVGVPNVTALLGALAPVAPAITAQPQSVTVNVGQPAGFSITATGTPAPMYQWQVSANGGTTWTALTEAAPYSGTTTSTLAISTASGSLAGDRYRCGVSNASGNAISMSATLTVVQPPVITSAASATVVYGQSFRYTITATNAPTSYAVNGLPTGLVFEAASATISGLPGMTGGFAVALGASNAAGTGTATLALTVTPAAATLTWETLGQTYDGTAKVVTVQTTPAGVACAVTYDGRANAPINAGTYLVSAVVTDSNYTGSASGTLTIAPASQAITFPALGPARVGSPPLALNATASSQLPVTYQSDNAAVATVSGRVLTIVGAGMVNLTASQGGDANHLAATPVAQVLVVNAEDEPGRTDVPALPGWGMMTLGALLALAAFRFLALRRTGGQI